MQTTQMTLLRRAKGGASEAWADLDKFYRPFIRRWFFTQHVSVDDAEDLTQEVLATLFRELPRFEHSGRAGAFRCWLRSTCLNRLRQHQRSFAVRDRLIGGGDLADADAISVDDPQSIAWDREHDRAILRYLFSLVEKQFEAVTMAVFRRLALEGASVACVAVEFGMTEGAVYVARSRVLVKLREEGERLKNENLEQSVDLP